MIEKFFWNWNNENFEFQIFGRCISLAENSGIVKLNSENGIVKFNKFNFYTQQVSGYNHHYFIPYLKKRFVTIYAMSVLILDAMYVTILTFVSSFLSWDLPKVKIIKFNNQISRLFRCRKFKSTLLDMQSIFAVLYDKLRWQVFDFKSAFCF